LGAVLASSQESSASGSAALSSALLQAGLPEQRGGPSNQNAQRALDRLRDKAQ
jgi:hypothetical protein